MSRTKAPRADLFTRSAEAEKVPSRRVRWNATYRLISSRYPPIELFERIAPQSDWQALHLLEALTDPRLRDAVGNISLVPTSKRINGPNASVVMAPFTHCSTSKPTRFSDGTYGIYYARRKFVTALLEVSFHMARFHRATIDPPMTDQYRTYKGSIDKIMNDIRGGGYEDLLQPDPRDYGKSQAFAATLRDAGSNGIVYPSVRHNGGQCIAAFWPNVVSLPMQSQHITLKWNGRSISEWFDGDTETWQPMPG